MFTCNAIVPLLVLAATGVADDAPPKPAPPAPSQSLAVLTVDRRLLLHDGADRPPRELARDIDTIASAATRHGILASRGREIVLVALDGSPPRTLVRHDATVRFPQPSPDGNSIAYSLQTARGWEVWLANADGSDSRRAAGSFAYGPTFSGQRLFFETAQGIAELDRASDKIVPLEAGHGAHTVRASSDGRTIAFTRGKAIHLLDLDTGQTRALTAGDAYDRFPSFDSTGKRLAFYRQHTDPAGRVSDRIVELDLESGLERIVVPDDALLACFVWRGRDAPASAPR